MPGRFPDIETDLFACLQCGYCRDVCPAYEQMGWERSTPRGKLFAMRAAATRNPMSRLLGTKRELDESFFKTLYHCTSCGMCSEVCHVDIPLAEVWEEVKEYMVRSGFEPLVAHKTLYERISNPAKRNPFHDDKDPEKDTLARRAAWLPPEMKLPQTSEVVFFAGCTASYRLQVLAQSAVKLLASAKVPFTVLGAREWCCGSPLLRTGQSDIVKEQLIPHNIEALEGKGAKTVVTACAGCFNTMRGDYPKSYGKLPFRLMHLTQYLCELIADSKLEFRKRIDKTVTYHDPCHLGRHSRVFEEPRKVIQSIPGLKLVEMTRNRERSRCCGAGGGFKTAFNDLAENIGAGRIMEAKETGAGLVVTPCPFCVINLNAGAKKAGVDMKTIDIVQLAVQALG